MSKQIESEEKYSIEYPTFHQHILDRIAIAMNDECEEIIGPGIRPFIADDIKRGYNISEMIKTAATRINDAQKIGALKTTIKNITSGSSYR